MNKLITLIACHSILFLCFIPSVHAQTWTQIGPNELSWANLFVTPHHEGMLFLKTGSGMWRSTDSGENWTAVTVDIPFQTLDLVFHPTSVDTVWGTGMWNMGWRDWFLSEDAGMTFNLHNMHFPQAFGVDQDGAVQFEYDPFNQDHMLALDNTEPALFAESFDQGFSWSEAWEFGGIPDSLYYFGELVSDVSFDPHQQGRLVATTDYYWFPTRQFTLIQSLDGGFTWQTIHENPDPFVGATGDLKFHPLIPGLLFARYSGFSIAGGSILSHQLVSYDNGESIEDLADPVSRYSKVQITSDGTIYGASRTGIYESEDGQLWFSILPEDARWPVQFGHWNNSPPQVIVAWWNPDQIFLNGYGQLYRSMNGGNSWDGFGSPGSIARVLEVSVSPDGQTIYATTDAGVSLSTDGGETWQPQFCARKAMLAVSPSNPERILFRWEDPSDYTYYLEDLQLSTDHGEHWSAIFEAWTSEFTFDPEDPDRIYTDSGNQYSADGGQTWQEADLGEADARVYGFDADEPDAVYAMTGLGLWKSVNVGESYSQWSVETTWYNSMTFRTGDDHAVLFDPVFGDDFGFYSHDNGLTNHHEITEPPEPRTDKILFTPSGVLAALCEDGLYESTDEGANWQRVAGEYTVYDRPYDYPIAWAISGDGSVFIASDDGGLWKGENVLGVDDNANAGAVADDFELLSVYPNPFNPELTITVTLYSPSNVSLKVVNIAGQTVAELASEMRMSAGKHEFSFDGSTSSSGVYFVHAEAVGLESSVRKVTLLK
jgi:Secretion system C-terminal sorting domain/BNR/Asp-box repeat